LPYYAEDEHSRHFLPRQKVELKDEAWWGEKLLQKGIALEDVEFLVQVLHPDPTQRPTAEDIIRSNFLEVGC